MTNQIRVGATVCLAVSALSMWACDQGPTSPSNRSPSFSVSGVVFTTTPTGTTRPVTDARVVETHSNAATQTDENGMFRIAGLPSGVLTLSASKSYYYVSNVTFSMSGDSVQDIEMTYAFGN
jgi:hypothetical protein